MDKTIKTRKRLINSITYKILEYRYLHSKDPNCIMLNQCAYSLLTADWHLMYKNEKTNEIYGVPVRVTIEATDDNNCPRFWLCEEGIVYNYDTDE